MLLCNTLSLSLFLSLDDDNTGTTDRFALRLHWQYIPASMVFMCFETYGTGRCAPGLHCCAVFPGLND